MPQDEREARVSFLERVIGPVIFVAVGLFLLVPLEIAGTLLRNVVRPFLWLRRRDECRRDQASH
jgi:hypothetical protein